MSKLDVLNPHNEFIPIEKLSSKSDRFSQISIQKFIKMIENNNNIWIFDLRSTESFSRNHIIQSKHCNCSTKSMTKMSLLKLKKEISSTKNVPGTIIMYNQDNNNYNNCLLDFIKELYLEFLFLEGGFEKFLQQAPTEFIKSKIQNKVTFSPSNPTEISEDIMFAKISQIERHLYLGNAADSQNLELLTSIGITDILCVTTNIKLHFEHLNLFQYKRIEANDSYHENLFNYFDDTFEFIDNVERKNGKVLVHCLAGVSRSVTIALAYLIKKYKMGVLDALDLIRKQRPVASPNLNFLGQLNRYSKEINEQS